MWLSCIQVISKKNHFQLLQKDPSIFEASQYLNLSIYKTVFEKMPTFFQERGMQDSPKIYLNLSSFDKPLFSVFQSYSAQTSFCSLATSCKRFYSKPMSKQRVCYHFTARWAKTQFFSYRFQETQLGWESQSTAGRGSFATKSEIWDWPSDSVEKRSQRQKAADCRAELCSSSQQGSSLRRTKVICPKETAKRKCVIIQYNKSLTIPNK